MSESVTQCCYLQGKFHPASSMSKKFLDCQLDVTTIGNTFYSKACAVKSKGGTSKDFLFPWRIKAISMNRSSDNFSTSTDQHWAHGPAPIPVTSKGKWVYHDSLRPNTTHPVCWSRASKQSWGLVHRQEGERLWSNQLNSVWHGVCMQQFILPQMITS